MQYVNEFTVYKVARVTHQPSQFYSAIMAAEDWGVVYRLGKWSVAPSRAAAAGYHLLAFSDLRYAVKFREQLLFGSVIFQATAKGIIKPLPRPGVINISRIERGLPIMPGWNGMWDQGTVMVMSLRPDLIVSSRMLHQPYI